MTQSLYTGVGGGYLLILPTRELPVHLIQVFHEARSL